MTRENYSTHTYDDRKPPTGKYAAWIAPAGPSDPATEHAALLTITERGHLDLIPMLGLDTHTCQRCDNRRNAT
jgi:hypothetical protein